MKLPYIIAMINIRVHINKKKSPFQMLTFNLCKIYIHLVKLYVHKPVIDAFNWTTRFLEIKELGGK